MAFINKEWSHQYARKVEIFMEDGKRLRMVLWKYREKTSSKTSREKALKEMNETTT